MFIVVHHEHEPQSFPETHNNNINTSNLHKSEPNNTNPNRITTTAQNTTTNTATTQIGPKIKKKEANWTGFMDFKGNRARSKLI
ncbi:hypothetical protein MTR_4g054580 [Medicago truncatula]|uniref:Uncharacterized protein n=1 Tax=Medicago truncatula TaxID=3880 RepID=G7JJR0_MEDTR|nr:hypothetical protein MTR_4g054580 [Medicago truncatula]